MKKLRTSAGLFVLTLMLATPTMAGDIWIPGPPAPNAPSRTEPPSVTISVTDIGLSVVNELLLMF